MIKHGQEIINYDKVMNNNGIIVASMINSTIKGLEMFSYPSMNIKSVFDKIYGITGLVYIINSAFFYNKNVVTEPNETEVDDILESLMKSCENKHKEFIKNYSLGEVYNDSAVMRMVLINIKEHLLDNMKFSNYCGTEFIKLSFVEIINSIRYMMKNEIEECLRGFNRFKYETIGDPNEYPYSYAMLSDEDKLVRGNYLRHVHLYPTLVYNVPLLKDETNALNIAKELIAINNKCFYHLPEKLKSQEQIYIPFLKCCPNSYHSLPKKVRDDFLKVMGIINVVPEVWVHIKDGRIYRDLDISMAILRFNRNYYGHISPHINRHPFILKIMSDSR